MKELIKEANNNGSAVKDFDHLNSMKRKVKNLIPILIKYLFIFQYIKDASGIDKKLKERIHMEYLYNDFVKDLKLGSEIEFTYSDIRYFVFYDDRGTILLKVNDNTKLIFENTDDFLSSGLFDTKTIFEIWDDIDAITVL